MTSRNMIILIIMLTVIVGAFALLITDRIVPAWLIGVVTSTLSGGLGILITVGDNE